MHTSEAQVHFEEAAFTETLGPEARVQHCSGQAGSCPFSTSPLNTVPEPHEPSTLPSPRPGGLLLPSPISLATLSHPAQTSELTNLMVATGTPARPRGGRHARPAPLPLGTSCHCRVSQSLEYIEPMRSGQWMSQLLAAED